MSPFTIQSRLLVLGLCFLGMASGCVSLDAGRSASAEIYDSLADGERQLADAAATARRQNKRVLLNLGANWCTDSQATARLLRGGDAAIGQEIERHYVLVMVDVNQKDNAHRNEILVGRLGNPLTRGIPVLLVLTPDLKLLNADPMERLRDDAHQDPAQILAYLRKWAAARE